MDNLLSYNVPSYIPDNEQRGKELLFLTLNVPVAAAEPVAELLKSLAENMLINAEKERKYISMNARNARKVKRLNDMAIDMGKRVSNGEQIEAIAKEMYEQDGQLYGCTYSHWLNHIKELNEAMRKQRNEHTFKLYKKGLSNYEISKEVDLSTRQVGHVIRTMKSKYEGVSSAHYSR